MEEFVRAARTDDVEALTSLDTEFREAMLSTPRGGPSWLRDHPESGSAVWARRLVDLKWAVYVAGIDGAVLGLATLRLPNDRSEPAVVEQLFVTAEARGLGLGDGLLEALLERSEAAGVSAIEAEALPGDRETKNLYERAGLVARLITVSRPLPR
jgi:GNAT superfamily N-acetyltransferase